MNRREIANGMAFFDWDGTVNRLSWYNSVLGWFAELGAEPELIAAFGPGFRHNRVVRHTRRRAFRVRGQASDMQRISLYSQWPKGSPNLAWDFSEAAVLVTDGSRTHMLLIWDNTIRPIDSSVVATWAARLMTVRPAAYGFCFQRPYIYGPAFYATGLVLKPTKYGKDMSDFTPEATRRDDIVGCWARETYVNGPRRHVQGMHRDIYRFNFLSPPHLERTVEGLTLSDWVQTDKEGRRGRMEQVHEKLWMWEVPDDARQDVRMSMIRAGLVICRRTDDPPGDI